MARRQTQYEKRRNTALAWWVAIIALGVMAWRTGRPEVWLLPVLAWVVYQLCYCPTTCGVQTVRGHPCRNATYGRLYACRDQPAHKALKADALWRLLGLRHGPLPAGPPPRGPRSANAMEPPPLPPSVEPKQQTMLYLTVAGLVVAVIQTAWSILA